MNLNSLDLNLIRVLDALLRERSVTRAGERIGLSQPAVSAALNRLRHALNDQLFVRQGNDMLPTPRAESLAGSVRAALAEIARVFEADEKFNPSRLERVFTLLGADFFSMFLMPELASRIAEAAPNVAFRFLDSARGDISRLLQDGAIDIALERPLDVPEWVQSTLLFRSPFVVIAANHHADPQVAGLRRGSVFPLDLFCALPHAIRSADGGMTGFTDRALAAIGRKRRVQLGLPHFQAVALAVARGRLIATVPSQFADAAAEGLGLAVYRPPIDIEVPEIKMYWHARHEEEAPHRWLRDRILSTIGSLGFNTEDRGLAGLLAN